MGLTLQRCLRRIIWCLRSGSRMPLLRCIMQLLLSHRCQGRIVLKSNVHVVGWICVWVNFVFWKFQLWICIVLPSSSCTWLLHTPLSVVMPVTIPHVTQCCNASCPHKCQFRGHYVRFALVNTFTWAYLWHDWIETCLRERKMCLCQLTVPLNHWVMSRIVVFLSIRNR